MDVITAQGTLLEGVFELARDAHDHTQEECAARLRELGWTRASQTTVTRIETGATKRPHPKNRHVIERYVAEVDLPPEMDTDEPDEFERLVRTMTDEGLLAPLQRSLVEAGITHLENLTAPMSDGDRATWVDLVRILRLEA